jgi:hypothetical protein
VAAMSEKSLDPRARRAARRVGLEARKLRWRFGTIDNLGEYRLVNAFMNICVGGFRFDLSAEEIIEHCAELADDQVAA